MKEHKSALINLLDKLSDKSIRRLYRLAEYLYIYVDEGGMREHEGKETAGSRNAHI